MKKFLIIFGVSTILIFGSLVTFTFLTTDIPASQIVDDFKSLGVNRNIETVMSTKTVKTVKESIDEFKANDAGTPNKGEANMPVGQGSESGFLNDKYPMIWNWPVVEQPGKYIRISSFMNPSRSVMSRPARPHDGMDINPQTPGTKGIQIVAAHHGEVTKSCHGCQGPGYGNWVEVTDHRTGYRTRYAHLAERSVKVGDIVKAGQQVGIMGATGRDAKTGKSSVTGIHLHFEVLIDKVKPGVPVEAKYKQSGKWYDPLASNITYDMKTHPSGGFKDDNGGKTIDLKHKFTTGPGEK